MFTRYKLPTLIIGFTAGVLISAYAYLSVNQAIGKTIKISSEDLSLFATVMEQIRENYVNDISDAELIENAIKGMLTGLDPHSTYLNTEANKNLAIQTKGEFGGLGIRVTMEKGLVKVISPIDNTPAARAGIEPQDLIVRLNNKPVMGMTLEEAINIMRGKIGTKITLTIVRESVEPFEVKIVRERIEIDSVKSRDLGQGYLYLRISTFSQKTKPQLDQEIKKALTSKTSSSKDGIQGRNS